MSNNKADENTKVVYYQLFRNESRIFRQVIYSVDLFLNVKPNFIFSDDEGRGGTDTRICESKVTHVLKRDQNTN